MKSRYKRYLIALKETARSFIMIIIVEIGLILLIGLLLQSNLLDIKTIISVVIPEVGISLFIFYLLGQKRRNQLDEAINLMDAFDKFSHLTIYAFTVFHFPFSVIFYYITNTHTMEAYIAPKYIDNLADQDVITKIFCKNEKEMKETLTKKKITLNERKPTLDELKRKK